jgi:hypothetical protein
MLTKPDTTSPVRKVARIRRRKVKRNPQRVLESVEKDWARWDKAADAEGVNFSEFTRRALEARSRYFVCQCDNPVAQGTLCGGCARVLR